MMKRMINKIERLIRRGIYIFVGTISFLLVGSFIYLFVNYPTTLPSSVFVAMFLTVATFFIMGVELFNHAFENACDRFLFAMISIIISYTGYLISEPLSIMWAVLGTLLALVVSR